MQLKKLGWGVGWALLAAAQRRRDRIHQLDLQPGSL
jgi:hypothetical protein